MVWWVLLGCGLGTTAPELPAPPEPEAQAVPGVPRLPHVPGPHPNILMIVADDLGVDKVGVYGAPGASRPRTPVLDALAEEGRWFRRAYANPACSPTRAAILTGRDARRTSIGSALGMRLPVSGLAPEEVTLAEVVGRGEPAYATEALGKWHLGGKGEGGPFSPNLQGFTRYAGSLGNAMDHTAGDGKDQSYSNWEKTIDGETRRIKTYMTADTVKEAEGALRRLEEPWFLYVALNAPHVPNHVPTERWRYSKGPFPENQDKYDAMVESVDIATGRILEALAPDVRENTWVVFIGDNGTPEHGVREPFPSARAKTTMFEGGIRVPLIITGPGIERPGEPADGLVAAADLFPTLAALAKKELSDRPIDGVPFLGMLKDPMKESNRPFVAFTRYHPNGFREDYNEHVRTVFDGRYKLIWWDLKKRASLYDLKGVWVEGADLLDGPLDPEAKAAHARLEKVMISRGGKLGNTVYDGLSPEVRAKWDGMRKTP